MSSLAAPGSAPPDPTRAAGGAIRARQGLSVFAKYSLQQKSRLDFAVN